METRIVRVRADRMRDGRIVYRGKRPRRRASRGAIFAGVFILAVLAGVYMKPKPSQAPPVVEVEPLVVMSTPTPIPTPTSTPVVEVEEVDEELVEMLALVIYQEAGADACSDETRRMVGEVAMNRVADSRFPDTLEEVLLQKQQYGRLYWTGLVWPERANTEAEAHAVQRAHDIARVVLSGEDELLPDDVIFQAEFKQGTETVAESDGIYFCR